MGTLGDANEDKVTVCVFSTSVCVESEESDVLTDTASLSVLKLKDLVQPTRLDGFWDLGVRGLELVKVSVGL